MNAFRLAPARIRVAHVAPGLDVGGLEKLLVEIARHIDRRQFSLHFVSLGSRGTLADDIEALGWPVSALELPQGVRPRIVWKLAHFIRSRKIDILHTHDDRPLIYGAPAARLAGVPCIHTKHYGVLPTNTRRRTFLTNLAARFVSDFVCVSGHSAESSQRGGVPAAKIRTIWNGIDLGRFPFSGPRADGPIITVARLSEEKGLNTLVQAAALVVKQKPETRFEIAGQGPLFASLQKLIADLQLGDHVNLLGEVRDVPALLERARLFVLPSRTEGISLTLLEAMSKGLPVVATRVGGNPEVVEADITGLLVPSQNPDDLASAILELLDDPTRARDMGEAGRRRALEQFDIRRMALQYEMLYRARTPHRLPRSPAKRGEGSCYCPLPEGALHSS
jgi:glycosyltransferase involved in cell wall biosynthesis